MKIRNLFYLSISILLSACKTASSPDILFGLKFGLKKDQVKDIINENIKKGIFRELDSSYDHYSATLKLLNTQIPIAIWLNPNVGRNELDSLTEIQIDLGSDIYVGSLPIKSLSKNTGPIRRNLIDSLLKNITDIYGQPDAMQEHFSGACKNFLISDIYGGDPDNPLTTEQLKEKKADESSIIAYFAELEKMRRDIFKSRTYYWTKLKSFDIRFEKNACLTDSINYIDTHIILKGK